jgi:prepilin-type N-terminal cleavage/methylation domain-containing protein
MRLISSTSPVRRPLPPRARDARGASSRAGFTLVEIIVTLILLGVVMGALLSVLVRQQRFYRSTSDVIDARTQVRQAGDLLPTDLRTISSSDVLNGTDIYAATDKAIEFRAITGSSIVCAITSGTKITLPPLNLASGTQLTTWITKPLAGDSVMVYDDGTSVGNTDDRWRVYGINAVNELAVGSSGACTQASGFVTAADDAAGRVSWQLNLPALATTIDPGAPVRIFHTRRYELYQPSTGSGWYLGSCEYATNPCTPLTPVSGPYAAYSATAGSSGLSFTYFDSLGATFVPSATLADRSRIWRIRLRARADTRSGVTSTGTSISVLRDSVSLDITLRNRR